MRLAYVLSTLGILAVACAIVPGYTLAADPSVGETFLDCPECPEMVVVPAGIFLMGSPSREREERYRDEGLPHRVNVRQPFAIGKYEVTRGQYAYFVEATGRKSKGCWFWEGEWKEDGARNWRSPGYSQTDEEPVVCVSYEDAHAYTEWLSRTTGHAYRLPSESKWEYSARAGTGSARYWGDYPGDACDYANVYDFVSESVNNFDWRPHGCVDGYAYTAPVGNFKANAFGLHDMLGNVWEWTEDCSNENYKRAPRDASAWKTGDCRRRILRGGSWYDQTREVRSANRNRAELRYKSYDYGFRVARSLP